MKKEPGCLGDIGDYTTQLCGNSRWLRALLNSCQAKPVRLVTSLVFVAVLRSFCFLDEGIFWWYIGRTHLMMWDQNTSFRIITNCPDRFDSIVHVYGGQNMNQTHPDLSLCTATLVRASIPQPRKTLCLCVFVDKSGLCKDVPKKNSSFNVEIFNLNVLFCFIFAGVLFIRTWVVCCVVQVGVTTSTWRMGWNQLPLPVRVPQQGLLQKGLPLPRECSLHTWSH